MLTRSVFIHAQDSDSRIKANLARIKLLEQYGRSLSGVSKTVNSDHLVLAAAVASYRMKKGAKSCREFCREFSLSPERMAEVVDLQNDLLDKLVELKFIDSRDKALDMAMTTDTTVIGRLAATAICAGLYPQLVRIMKPPQRFFATHGGAIEREAYAREIKYYIRDNNNDSVILDNVTTKKEKSTNDNYVKTASDLNISTHGLHQVFIHPTSVNFSACSYQSNFLAYGTLQFDQSGQRNRVYVRDCTEVSIFALLFFSEDFDVDISTGIVTVADFIRFEASARVVAIVRALRDALDSTLRAKIENPSLDVTQSPHIRAVVNLISNDGF
jgi:ATP-dependent RNA helicase DHX57